MPPDEKILTLTGLQKITNRYQDVHKIEVKFRGKVPVNLEFENKIQKNGNFDNQKIFYSEWNG